MIVGGVIGLLAGLGVAGIITLRSYRDLERSEMAVHVLLSLMAEQDAEHASVASGRIAHLRRKRTVPA